MTNEQKFVELAIEGQRWPGYHLVYVEENGAVLLAKEKGAQSIALIVAEILIDPKAWKAVGKVKGWGTHAEVNHQLFIGELWNGETIEDALALILK